MRELAYKLFEDYDSLLFEQADHFVWSPSRKTIKYDEDAINKIDGIWSLLHELGHAKLNHTNYRDDLHLLIMEVQAWAEAKKLAKTYGISIDDKHIENCLDSYRDWLHARSKCMDCQTVSMQIDATTYRCHNCFCKWRVPASKTCKVRKYRI